MMKMKESEWKRFKKLREDCLERFYKRIFREINEIINSEAKSAHARYRDLYKLIHDRDKELANAFDNPRRSGALVQLMLMYRLNLITDSELDEFEVEAIRVVKVDLH